MKKVLLLFLTLLFDVVLLAQNPGPDPDHAKYFIKGYLNVESISGEIRYKLSNLTSSQGDTYISFRKKNYLDGMVTEYDDVAFEFKDAETNYPNGGFENEDNKLQYWRFDEELQEWIPDIETRQGSASFETNKVMTIMLVMDCSTSLGADFNEAKQNAIYLIDRLYRASDKGNIRLGIVGFSTIPNTLVFPITSLDDQSINRMKSFIDNLDMSNGTALYYSMDEAVQMLVDYVNASVTRMDYADSYLITFTDGVDQTSQKVESNVLTADRYYEFLKQKLGSTTIYDKAINRYVIGMKGRDITTSSMEKKFDRVLATLASSSQQYRKIEQISKLRDEFDNIVKELTNHWTNLTCYVSKGFSGKVGWTFASNNTEKLSEPVEAKDSEVRRKPFFGLNIGAGVGYYYDRYAYYYGYRDNEIVGGFSAGLDFAFPIKEYSGFGAYISVGYNSIDVGTPDLNIGVLGITGFDNGRACYLGGGFAYLPQIDELGGDVRVGFKFKNGYYLFFDSCYFPYIYDTPHQDSVFTMRLHIGYAF